MNLLEVLGCVCGRAAGRVVWALFVAGGCLVTLAARAEGQSVTSGSVEGTVRSTTGERLAAARVVITSQGAPRHAWTAPDGTFTFWLLPAGEYTLVVEKLGYRPKRVHPLPVRPGARIDLPISIAPVRPPVSQEERVRVGSAGAIGSTPGMRQWFSSLEQNGLADDRREAIALGRLSTRSSGTLATEGLPGRLTGTAVDGLLYEAARHPDLAVGPRRFAIGPLSAVSHAELITNTADVEWGESGGIFAIHSRRGGQRLEVHAFGQWAGDALSFADLLVEPDLAPYTHLRAGLLLSGPITGDTAQFVLGVEGQNVEAPTPRAWEPAAQDAALLAAAQDSNGVGLASYMAPRVVDTRTIHGFGGVDWQVTSRHRLSLLANVASIPTSDPASELAADRSASLGSRVEGTDVRAALVLASELSSSLASELRIGMETSSRDYLVSEGTSAESFGSTYLPGTTIADPGVRFGVDPAFPGRFERRTLRATEALHLRSGAHRFKFGAHAAMGSHENAYVFGRAGAFAFGGVDEFARRDGVFMQAVGPLPLAKFTVPRLALFFQDTWSPAPGLELTLGVRSDFERLPASEVTLNSRWFDLTEVANTDFEPNLWEWSERAALRWDIRGDDRWVLQAAAGAYAGSVDPGILTEVVAVDKGIAIRRGLGVLSRWVGLPDSASAPVVGDRLTLLDRSFEAPRTTRASFGLSHLLDSHTALQLAATFRRTSALPQRRDANLLPAPTGQDQYGRPIFGSLAQRGALVAALPRSNRRFSDFDLVSQLESSAVSEYWGLTIGVERRSDNVSLLASYTFSRTQDDWLAGRSAGPEAELSPFPQGLAGADWADGRSDFDVPHRLVLGAEARLPVRIPLHLSAVYGYHSGRPFTPGFRDGVDVNADGSGMNDPAFVDGALPGVSGLLAEWDCLRKQEGRFAERNACRAPGVHTLDVRLRMAILRWGASVVELVVDGLNLISSEDGRRDRALYLIDASRSISTDPVTGTVAVPLVANPRFGELLARDASARMLRLGLRIGT